MPSESLGKAIDREVAVRLQARGFTQKTSGIFLFPIRHDWYGWVGLNHANYSGSYVLNPVVGVRSSILEQVLARLQNAKPSTYAPPSLSTTLALLMGMTTMERWTFDKAHDPCEQLDDVAGAILSAGVPYMERYCSLAAIARELAPRGADVYQTASRYPVILFMLGKRDEALCYVREQLTSLRDPPPKSTYDEFYAAFAERFFVFAADPSSAQYSEQTT